MKFGSETGSLVNHMMSLGSAPEVTIGMGATLLSWTDRDAATVVSYDAKRQIVGVQQDDAKRTDTNGISEAQEYEFTPNPNAYISYFKFGRKGWNRVRFNEETKRWVKTGSGGLSVGVRSKFHDFSF